MRFLPRNRVPVVVEHDECNLATAIQLVESGSRHYHAVKKKRSRRRASSSICSCEVTTCNHTGVVSRSAKLSIGHCTKLGRTLKQPVFSFGLQWTIRANGTCFKDCVHI